MKKLFAFILLIALFAPVANAQVPTYAPQSHLSSYVVAIGATSNSVSSTAGIIDCRKQQNVTLQWYIASPIFAETTNIVMRLSASVDGTTFDTNRWVLTASATTAPQNVLVTNLAVAGIGYVRVDSITATGIAATNHLKYGLKISSP